WIAAAHEGPDPEAKKELSELPDGFTTPGELYVDYNLYPERQRSLCACVKTKTRCDVTLHSIRANPVGRRDQHFSCRGLCHLQGPASSGGKFRTAQRHPKDEACLRAHVP